MHDVGRGGDDDRGAAAEGGVVAVEAVLQDSANARRRHAACYRRATTDRQFFTLWLDLTTIGKNHSRHCASQYQHVAMHLRATYVALQHGGGTIEKGIEG
jgi:hypothetical protein